MVSYFFFFFKQKTAYEILARLEFRRVLFRSRARAGRPDGILAAFDERLPFELTGGQREIGRASCRERVYISVVAVSLKKKLLDYDPLPVNPPSTLMSSGIT